SVSLRITLVASFKPQGYSVSAQFPQSHLSIPQYPLSTKRVNLSAFQYVLSVHSENLSATQDYLSLLSTRLSTTQGFLSTTQYFLRVLLDSQCFLVTVVKYKPLTMLRVFNVHLQRKMCIAYKFFRLPDKEQLAGVIDRRRMFPPPWYLISPLMFLELRVCSVLTTENVDITTCNGNTTDGSVIKVKYIEMKSPCECQIEPQFVGVLKFASNVVTFTCYTEINIFDKDRPDEVLRLACGLRTSGRFNVTEESVLFMTPEYVGSSTGTFHQEMIIFEDISFNGTVSVTCGSNFSRSMTTTKWTINTDGTNNRITTNSDASLKSARGEIQNDKADNTVVYIILGAAGFIVVFLAVVTVIAVCHMRRKQSVQSTTDLKDEFNYEQKKSDIYKELPDNPLYHSYQSEDMEHQVYAQPNKNKEKTQIKDVPKSVTQANSSKEEYCDIVYAKVNKQ
ncbi:uncharacterized protein LOC133200385, partial [Saccostrea echinata]|uniref:uncharacterized protein LOC133200385 n=1 Tax=Saccostrea echinata TaxID=191078 RepID=UPI002A8275CD